MQTFPGSCSPERLHTLQKIFDAIWLEVQAGGGCATEALRDEIARRVAQHVADLDPQPDQIAKAVLNSLDAGIDRRRPADGGRPVFLLSADRAQGGPKSANGRAAR